MQVCEGTYLVGMEAPAAPETVAQDQCRRLQRCQCTCTVSLLHDCHLHRVIHMVDGDTTHCGLQHTRAMRRAFRMAHFLEAALKATFPTAPCACISLGWFGGIVSLWYRMLSHENGGHSTLKAPSPPGSLAGRSLAVHAKKSAVWLQTFSLSYIFICASHQHMQCPVHASTGHSAGCQLSSLPLRQRSGPSSKSFANTCMQPCTIQRSCRHEEDPVNGPIKS